MPSGLQGRKCPYCNSNIIPGQRGRPRKTCGRDDCQRQAAADRKRKQRKRDNTEVQTASGRARQPESTFTSEDWQEPAPETPEVISTEWGDFETELDAFLEAPREHWHPANVLLVGEGDYAPELIDTAGKTAVTVLHEAFGIDIAAANILLDTCTRRFPKGAVFDPVRARRVTLFLERCTVHTKSRWARRPFDPALWQRVIISLVFGTVRYDDQWLTYVRLYVLAWLEVARKNGKSELMAALGLYLLIADGEEGAEIYGAACDRDQARAVYNVARRMCEISPELKRLVEAGKLYVLDSKKTIKWTPTDSEYVVVAADAGGNLGSNPYAVLFDEILTQPNRDLWDAFTTGQGTREQFLMLAATTAGNDPTSFCFTEHEFSLRVAEDPEADPSRFVFIRVVPEDVDWRDEANWWIGNPALGDFLHLNSLKSDMTIAVNQGDLMKVSAFRQFRCNQWQRQANRWIDITVWDDNYRETGDWEEETAEPFVGWSGLDLSATDDFTAHVMVFDAEDRVLVIPRFWIPEAAVHTKHKRISSWLLDWHERGLLTITDGEVVNDVTVAEDIIADLTRFHIGEMGYDQWNALSIVRRIETTTETVCVKVPQTTMRLNAPSKQLMKLLGWRMLATNNNPILRWMADNVQAQSDPEGNIKPSKNKSPEKIDGIAALVNALAVMNRERDLEVDVGFMSWDDLEAELEI